MEKKLNIQNITLFIKQMVKHYCVGVIGSITDYACFNFFMFLNFGILISQGLNYAITIALSFLLQKFFTYKAYNNSGKQLLLYLALAAIYMTVETSLLFLLIKKLNIVPAISKLITLGTLSPINFLVQKFFIFKK